MRFGEDDGGIAADGILSGRLEPAVRVVDDAVGSLAVVDDPLVLFAAAVEEPLELALVVHGRQFVEQLLQITSSVNRRTRDHILFSLFLRPHANKF